MFKENAVKWSSIVAVMVAAIVLSGIGVAFASQQRSNEGDDADAVIEIIKFDVAEDTNRFVFDDAPLFDDGLPAHGNSFITQGYIYEHGTLDGSNVVLADGSPEFPDKVIGTWVCRGWLIGDAAHTESGPWVITTQIYNFGDEYGNATIVSEGYELADINVPIQRAITGGTGEYSTADGQAVQELLGFNGTEGVNVRFELMLEK